MGFMHQIKLRFGVNPSSAELSEKALGHKLPWLKQSIREFTALGPSTPPMFERSGLVTAATSFVVAASAAFLPENFLTGVVKHNLNLVYAIGAGGLGLSLFLIHIYVTEIKRTLQAFWGLGVAGPLATYACLAIPAGKGLVQYVVDNPIAIWFVGPLFASLTGLVFKEGMSELDVLS